MLFARLDADWSPSRSREFVRVRNARGKIEHRSYGVRNQILEEILFCLRSVNALKRTWGSLREWHGVDVVNAMGTRQGKRRNSCGNDFVYRTYL